MTSTSGSDSESDSQSELSQKHRHKRDKSTRSKKRHSSTKRSKARKTSTESREMVVSSGRKKRYSSDRSRSRSPKVARSRSPRPSSYEESSRYTSRGTREEPSPSHCLGVFGLSSFTDETDLRSVFGQYGKIEDINIITDKEFGKSKGFAFVYFKNTEDAIEARKATQGLKMDGREIRVDYSLTTQPHPKTPGKYLGRASQRNYRSYDSYKGSSYKGSNYKGSSYGSYGSYGGYSRSRRDSGSSYSYGGKRSYGYRQSNYDDQYYDDYDSGYSNRRRRYSPPPYSSRRY